MSGHLKKLQLAKRRLRVVFIRTFLDINIELM